MSVTRRRLRAIAAVALCAGLAVGTAACSKKKAATPSGPVTIVVQTFGNFGYDKAVADWNAAHTDIKIDHQKQGELRDYAPKLAQWLSAGSGAGDVIGLEEGQLLTYIPKFQLFTNLFDQGGQELKTKFPGWKFDRGTADGGKVLLGLGTDVGGMALCYRPDLFKKANLPTDRVEVGNLIKTWDDYFTQGKKFAAANTGAKWTDSATSIVQTYIMQNGKNWFYDDSGKFVGDTNPVVKDAWTKGLQMAADGLTAKLVRWNADWDAAFKNSKFATAPCPAWFAGGVIPPRAGDANKGNWDVATIPGGAGNWGGSYLAIPKQSKHPKEAYQVAKYLTGKEGQLDAYKEAGAMPSNLEALADTAFKDSKNDYLNNAPVGQIFSQSVQGVTPMVLGPQHQVLWETILEPHMQKAEQGGPSTWDAEWAKWVDEAKKLVGS
ncbi:MAG TPA: extracellular solute-binding protein [Micromonosporaceae bacterium]|nr:extracellular solute-binding protein [Micromonosporaceae bacterium]